MRRRTPAGRVPRAAYRIRQLRMHNAALREALADAIRDCTANGEDAARFKAVIAAALEEIDDGDDVTALAGRLRLSCAVSDKPEYRERAWDDLDVPREER